MNAVRRARTSVDAVTPLELVMRLNESLSSLRGAHAPAPSAPPQEVAAGIARSAARSRGGHRVLLVDDDPSVLQGLRHAMEVAGFTVTCADSLARAAALIRNESFHLVVTDLYLGEQDLGHQVADVARERRPHTPVIVMTGRPTFDGAQEALRNHVADIVVKPLPAETLIATCRRVIHDTELTRRNQELESCNQVLTSVLPRTIEMKDPTTSGHAARVVGYADTLAARCHVSDDDRASLRLAALLHDIGKIGVPDQILTKPGALTQDEMEVVKRHPQMGYEVLAPLKEHEDVRNWVYQHHERWDGRGYPQGLRGEEVALPGRILVLAEVYDALAEQRSYKPAWPVPKIVALFREQAGRQFDPALSQMVADGLEKHGYRYFAPDQGMLF